jgi:hypothetical protein
MLTTRNLKQSATHWATVPDGYGGYTYSTPKILRCRWENKQEVFRKPNGDESVSEAVVYLDAKVEVGDLLYLGETTAADPYTLTGVYEVRQYNESPDLRALQTLRKAIL